MSSHQSLWCHHHHIWARVTSFSSFTFTLHGMFTNTVCSHAQCVHIHSVFTYTVCSHSHTRCVHINGVFTYTVCSHAQCYIHLHVTHIVLHTDTKLVLPTYECLFFFSHLEHLGSFYSFTFEASKTMNFSLHTNQGAFYTLYAGFTQSPD